MKKIILAALAAGAVLSTVSLASAQVYLDIRPQYRERHYDYDRRACPRGYDWVRGYGCVRHCPRGYRWRDGACRPWRY